MGSPFEKGRPTIWDENTNRISELPKSCGAYRIVDRVSGSSADYIGITGNIYNRIANHRSSTEWYSKDIHIVHVQTCMPCSSTWKELREWEVNKIKQHDPKFNKYKGGNGREPDKLWYNGEVIEIGHNESISDLAESIGFLRRVLDILPF